MTYPAIFTQTADEKKTVLVYVPDLDRSTEGYGLDDAIKMARDLIGNMLYDEPSDEIPTPSEIDSIDVSKSEFSNAGKSFVSLVDVDINAFRKKNKSRAVRRNITLPEWLDDMANEAKINVSALVQEALKQRLEIA